MSQLGVVHLVRAHNGLPPFTNFLDAYTRHPGGAPHDLLIVFKGFSTDAELQPYRDCLKTIAHQELRVSDLGLDLRAYSVACRHFDYSYLCFLNSYCVPLDENWLAKMFTLIQQPQAGVVGASGSWESMYTNSLGGPTGAPLPSRHRTKSALRRQLNRCLFHPFPNHHLRTNTFIISRKLMLEVWPRHIITKSTAYLFENGRNSFTQRVLRRGLKTLVVGRDGQGYEKEQWALSNTFRQSNQENLLVADNQTRNYAAADFETRQYLSGLAWGGDARPARP